MEQGNNRITETATGDNYGGGEADRSAARGR